MTMRSTASERALMLVFFSVKVPHRQKQSLAMSCASLAESYIIEVVKTFQTTAVTELVTGLPLVLRARETANTGRE